MRADRLLSLLMLMEVYRKMTAQELANRLEVSERTIHRDMEALSASGVPVYAERGTGGGWSLQEGYHMKLNGLSQAEIRSLFLNSPSHLLADLGLEHSSEEAYRKLSVALSPTMRHNAEYARQRLHVDGAGWHKRDEQVPYLQIVHTAVWEQRKLIFTYEKLSDNSRLHPLPERVVHPLGLVAKGHVWYLVALTEEEQIRSYRISRVQSASITDEPAIRPEHFDLAAYWEQSKQELKRNLPSYKAELLVESSCIDKLQQATYLQVERTGPAYDDPNGWLPVVVDFQTLTYACEFVLAQGSCIRVLHPEQLRDAVIQRAQAVLGLYS